MRTPHHVLSLCVVISKKFPRLLAEREIIANALYLFGFLPELPTKFRNKSEKDKSLMEKYKNKV